MKHRFPLALLFAVVAVGVPRAGQAPTPPPSSQAQPPPPSAQTPTFKSQVEYVEVDALVTDDEGRFVRDLTRDDFQVFEDGQPQTISTFSLVDIPIDRADRPLFAAAPIEPDVLSNEKVFEGRVYVLILDALHTEALRTPQVRRAARQFIERNLGANDMMAVVHTGGRSDAAQEFTSNKRLLLASVDKFAGRKIQSAVVARNEQYFQLLGTGAGGRVEDPWEAERAYNAKSTLRAVKDISEWLTGLRGRRKTVIFISEGIDYDITNIIPAYNEPSNSASVILEDIRETIAATARSNVAIYAVDPRGLTDQGDVAIGVGNWADAQPGAAAADGTAPPDSSGIGMRGLRMELMLSQDSLRALSDETNGYAAVNSNDFAGAFERIVRDNSSYYVLAYYPASTRRDGRFHRIQVRVGRPGMTVRARRGYVAPRGNTPATKPPAPVAGASAAATEALNSPLPVSGLSMQVFTAPFKATAPNASVLLVIELKGANLTLDPGSKVELSYFAFDGEGKSRGGRTDAVTLNLRPETKARVAEGRLRVLNRMELPPGRYTLRVAAHNPTTTRVGSLSHELEVPDFAKQPFTMSGLVLTSMSGSATATVRPDPDLQSVLPAAPIAARTFPQNDEIALYTEVYESAAVSRKPHSIDIVTTVRSDDGTVVFRHEEERQSSELQGGSGGYGYQARIPLFDLAPGSYVLGVETRSRLGDHPSVSRQVQFAVTPAQQGAVMRLLDRGDQSNVDEVRQVVAKTDAEWDALWRQHSPDREQPTVDLAREMVAAVFLGSRPSAGFSIEIVGAAERSGALIVSYRERRPPADALTAQVLTFPYHIVALPKYAGDVRFERTE